MTRKSLNEEFKDTVTRMFCPPAAAIAAHYKHGLCKGGCGETVLFPRDLCNRCYADAKGPFSFGGESDE